MDKMVITQTLTIARWQIVVKRFLLLLLLFIQRNKFCCYYYYYMTVTGSESWPLLVVSLSCTEFTHLYDISSSETPSYDDLRGALSAILRLHKLYSLRVSDMYAGNYSGYLGPSLSSEDAYYIGKQAFGTGMLNESLVWLEHAEKEQLRDMATRGSSSAHNLMTQAETETKANVASVSMEYKLAAIQCLLGRAYFYVCMYVCM